MGTQVIKVFAPYEFFLALDCLVWDGGTRIWDLLLVGGGFPLVGWVDSMMHGDLGTAQYGRQA